MRTAVPARRATAPTVPARKPWTDAASLGSSVCRASRTVSGPCAATVSMRTALSLSVNVTARPAVVRDQPSGTLTENPAPGGLYATYAWVSGMSPAGLTSGVLASAAAVRPTRDDDDGDEAPHPVAARATAAAAPM